MSEEEKKRQLLAFLHQRVFDPALATPGLTKQVRAGVQLTAVRMAQLPAASIRQYFWSAIIGTEQSIPFADLMQQSGLLRFEDVYDEFRRVFTDEWLTS